MKKINRIKKGKNQLVSYWYYEHLGWMLFWYGLGKIITLPFNIIGRLVKPYWYLEKTK